MNKFRKKLGAGVLSLSLLAGGGLHNFAFADPDPTTDYNIAVNEGNGNSNSEATFTSGMNQDTENSIEAVEPSSSAYIRGWQTEAPEGPEEGYAVNVTWGDMIFVFDRGNYDTSTGKLTRASHYTGETGLQEGTAVYDGIEMGGTDGDVNKWYGFNGEKNKVTVTNISTGAVNFDAAVTMNTENDHIGTTQASLYKEVASSDAGTALEGISHNPDSGNKWVEWSTTQLAAPVINDSGTGSVEGTSGSAYVNLTGTPTADLTTVENSAEILGTITLTFSKVTVTP